MGVWARMGCRANVPANGLDPGHAYKNRDPDRLSTSLFWILQESVMYKL